jgi:hypothetical protein
MTVETYRLRSEDLTWRALNDEVVILDLRASSYFSVNNTGKLLWELLEVGATEDQLMRSLVDQYGVTEAAARSDVGTFLRLCTDRDLLTRSSDQA